MGQPKKAQNKAILEPKEEKKVKTIKCVCGYERPEPTGPTNCWKCGRKLK